MDLAPRHLARLLQGPPLRWPRALDAAGETWARLPPRGRTLVTLIAVLALAGALHLRLQTAERRWGGPPRPALVATQPLPVGAAPAWLRRVELPPRALPAGAVHTVPPRARLAFALPAGAVLTRAHLHPRGPAVGLPPTLRAVPIPVEEGWGVAAGGWVDVWVLGTDGDAAVLVARSRPVVQVSGSDTATALVGLSVDELPAATGGLAAGRVLLTHAPPPPARTPSPHRGE